MNESSQKKLLLAREIVWSLDAGVLITFLLGLLRGSQLAPLVTDILLRPSYYFLPAVYGTKITNRMTLALSDAVFYGLMSFVVMHLWLGRRRLFRRAPPRGERRRAFRVALATPVFVYGWVGNEPFAESSQTLNVSEIGGLISLSARVVASQELVLTNLRTNVDVPCRITRSITGDDGKTFAGLAFLQESPGFWQIEFVAKKAHSSENPQLQ